MEEEYGLRKMDGPRIDAVEAHWRTLAGEDEFNAECTHLFRWCRTGLDDPDQPPATELYTVADEQCHAILELYDAHLGKQTKLLKLHLSPAYWDADEDIDIRAKTMGIITAVFSTMLIHGKLANVRDVKLYGRSNLMYGVLKAIEALWDSKLSGVTAHLEGRWLRMEFSKESQ